MRWLRHPPRVWLLWGVGAVAIVAVSLTLADPAFLMLALDPELVAVLVLSSLGFARELLTVLRFRVTVRGLTHR